MAESCLMLGRVSEALSSYKMLLYFSPTDAETIKIVQELEAQAYEKGTLVLRTDTPPSEPVTGFDIRPVSSVIEEDPSVRRGRWIRRIEILQDMLQRVERYRSQSAKLA
jgi:hypothetical protein